MQECNNDQWRDSRIHQQGAQGVVVVVFILFDVCRFVVEIKAKFATKLKREIENK